MSRYFILIIIMLFGLSSCASEEYHEERSYIQLSNDQIKEIAGLTLDSLKYTYFPNSEKEVTLSFKIKLNDEVVEEYSLNCDVETGEDIILRVGFDGSKLDEAAHFIIKLDGNVKKMTFENFIVAATQSEGEYVSKSYSNDGIMNIMGYRFNVMKNDDIVEKWGIEARLIEDTEVRNGT